MNNDIRKNVDLLVEQFWKRGYFTLSRKYGKYLPEPPKVGNYDVDIVARYKNDYAIGITLNEVDFSNEQNLIEKLTYLATRKTKYTNKNVSLFVGVPSNFFKYAKLITEKLPPEAKINIKVFPITEHQPIKNTRRRNQVPLFA